MKLAHLVPLAALLLATAAHAQIFEAHAELTIPHASHVQNGYKCFSSPVFVGGCSDYVLQYTGITTVGVAGGLTINFLPLHVVNVGLDLRGYTKPGTAGIDAALPGIRVEVKPPALKIKPYVVASFGAVQTRTTNLNAGSTTANNTYSNLYGVYEVFGGVDRPINHYLDYRIIEVGGGHSVGDGSAGGIGLFNISSGIVAHF